MKFEVVNKDGQVVMWTDSIDCIPTSDELDVIASSGYRYKIDGKVVSKSRVNEAVGGTTSTASVLSSTSSKVDIQTKSKTKIKCLETGKVYANKSEASRDTHVSDSSIYDSIKLKKSVKGLTFVTVND